MLIDKKRVIIIAITVLVVMALFSFTIGRGIIEDKQPTLYSFSVINFSGYLFFLFLPVEALVPYYLSEGYSGIILIFLAVITALIAQMLDYSVGYSVSESVIHDIIGKWRYQKAEKTIQKYGNTAVFVFNLLPLSSPLIVLAAGVLRFDFKRVMLYSAVGLFAKYAIIVFVYTIVF
ncbi:MAG: VTT domain-containing protein [Nanoarchaeota archaeon]|nr:VTT domain-containing protein [Nanoarchaeota archaeon]MBU1270460.1 VTT domain-containing protein [Nanoarchaeota archaeon]MBU2442566.1 VTT domain-containing protein [Nanoarchaeota archaeon]